MKSNSAKNPRQRVRVMHPSPPSGHGRKGDGAFRFDGWVLRQLYAFRQPKHAVAHVQALPLLPLTPGRSDSAKEHKKTENQARLPHFPGSTFTKPNMPSSKKWLWTAQI